ncbi:MAG TPA: cytidylate kinase-like family protein [Gemmatimonadaceae bacterium]|nr:cytidylate kinase-like family protein [Gemmatimonadaceae bacterium]
MAIITVSRMFGSGGSDVAERIARSLGWELLDNAFVDAVAERLGVPSAEVEKREERVASLAQRLAESLTLGNPETFAPATATTLPPSEDRIVEVTTRIIEEAVARGPAVLVGRGAQAVLASRDDVIHVFCYAPRPALIARVAARMKISAQEAEKLTDDTNRQREQYVKRHWKRAWRDPSNYHLCLDTEFLGVDGAADVVTRLARERFGVEIAR